MEIVEIIGFDLGHGETAIAKARVESIEPPEMLEVNNKKVQITALGWHPDLGYLVGEQALIQVGVTQIEIAFKQKPNADLHYRKTIQNFLETYYNLLKKSKQIEGGENSHFFVGCPSGWSLSDRQNYQTLLKETGIPLLNVVPESRAAFMHAREAGKLGYDSLKSAVLIIDIGSSTTDFTLVKSLHEIPLDFGSNHLGASLIDKAIFNHTLANHEDCELLTKVFQQYPHHLARCEIAARKAKEDYFSNEKLYTGQNFARGFESINEQIYFVPQVNQTVMKELLNQPLPELENKSWLEAFQESVSEAKETLKDRGIIPKVVLMTGGASRMQFTRQICQEMFPEPNTQVRPDPEPERCIALGLARVGRWDLRATEFKKEVNKKLDSQKLKELISRHIPELIQLLAQPLSETLIENAIKPSLKDWRNNKIRTLANLETKMKEQAEELIVSDKVRQVIRNQSIAWFNSKIQPELAQETDPICRKYQIPRSSLRFEEGINPAVVNPELSLGDTILADTVALIVNIVIGSGTVGSLITLILTGHFTWPIVLVYGVSVLAAGVEITRSKTQAAIKEKLDVPSWSRRVILGDNKIDSICDQAKPELENVFRQQLTENQEVFDELIAKVGQELKKALNAKAEEAVILIQ
ncbi:Hsp70 family protein [Oscillatoria salina]|uniref:Hsp70 family protein n=1 Tax=Oscillatoria salina TaxID=331517 RepID=UPI0013B5CB18|nr:Hsp70 family protein [Oscillatoria salina]MBZ8182352.1 Hsp70 family protein [Oscillatoria salina IIICB1]NET87925.1 Hsp70 family protein [Kamptonema sp. SIO1D9]